MNLIELRDQIDLLIKCTKHPEDKNVVISLSQSSIGPRASVGIKSIYIGFDHEHNQIRIEPTRTICDKSIFENKNKIGIPAYIRESSDGKLLNFCPECFTRISKKDSYCRDCGTKICHEENFIHERKDIKYKSTDTVDLEDKELVDKCIDKYKMLYGLSPHNKPSNQVYKDGYFARSIAEDFPEEIRKKAIKEINKLRGVD